MNLNSKSCLELNVRPFNDEDSSSIANLFYETVHRVNSKDYSSAQIQAWAPRVREAEHWKKRLSCQISYVAVFDNAVVGFADLELNGHIDCLYAHPEFQGKGVGHLLMQTIEGRAKGLGLKRLFAEVSITAKLFFEKRGYKTICENPIKLDEIILKNFTMEKYLYEKEDQINIVTYDPSWPEKARQEISTLKQILPPLIIQDIQHIGSTSIQGCSAKPILDLLTLVHSIDEAKKSIEIIKSLGYVFWEDNPDQTKLFFVKGMPPFGKQRTHHLHILEDKEEFHRRISFRNYLNSHPEEVKRYENLKLQLSLNFKEEREAYTKGKAEFVAEILNKASNQN